MKNSLKSFQIGINPCDTLFFRNGTPFGMGEETWADSALLPNPSVIWGALFTRLIQDEIIQISDLDALKIKQIFFCELKTGQLHSSTPEVSKMYVPAPLDIFKVKGYCAEMYTPVLNTDIVSSITPGIQHYSLPKITNEKVDTLDQFWITINSLRENYPKRDNRSVIIPNGSIAKPSPKIGIGRNSITKNVEEGYLYRIEMSELNKNMMVGLEIEAPENFLATGLLRLGGEGKNVAISAVNFDSQMDVTNSDSNRFKLYFQTPSFFESGDGISELSNLKSATLLSATIGKPMHIGGFDMAARTPKPMRKAVPPGSVFYFEGIDLANVRTELVSIFEEADTAKGFNGFRIIQD
jgi:CRISPR-associated protein Cmr3